MGWMFLRHGAPGCVIWFLLTITVGAAVAYVLQFFQWLF
jgi:hypothetical protein